MIDITLDTFTPHVGQPFVLHLASGERVTIMLDDASAAPTDDDPRRTRIPFSLIFRPSGKLVMGQGMYRLEREGLGVLDIFLVPILPDRQGARIQAVFA